MNEAVSDIAAEIRNGMSVCIVVSIDRLYIYMSPTPKRFNKVACKFIG